MNHNREYFEKIALLSQQFIDDLAIELIPQPLNYTLINLKDKVENKKRNMISMISRINKKINPNNVNNCAQGLNTIGMLTDRFTILLIREWCIKNKGVPNAHKAETLYATQTMEIMQAMAEAKQGYSSLNSKITNIKANATANSWEEAYYGLFTTNLLLWESQEVLYIKDIQTLPTEEIRDYIKWFSYGNILRNEYIELCEQQYWLQFKKPNGA